MLDFDVKDAPDQVPLRRAKVKQTLVALARNGILGLRQVKQRSAVIEHDGIPCSGEEVFTVRARASGVIVSILSSWLTLVCDV